MTREERLKSCTICAKKGFDINKGVVCSLTNEHASFEDQCPDYIENPDIQKVKLYSKHVASKEQKDTDSMTKIRSVIQIIALFALGIYMIYDPSLFANVDASGRRALIKLILGIVWGIPGGVLLIFIGIGYAYYFYDQNFAKNKTF